jgi:hypothetical protein
VRKVDVAVAAVVVAATDAAMVALPGLGADEPELLQAPSGEVVEIHPDGLDHDPGERDWPVTMDLEEPLGCMVHLDCLLQEVQEAVAESPVVEAVAGATVDDGTADSAAVTDETVPRETPLPPTA